MPSLCPYKAAVMAALQWLVALVVLCAAAQSRGECITGLVDTATLALWSEEYGAPLIDLEEQSNVQYIIPEIQFRCTGRVTKWIIGAEFNSSGGNIRYPVMGVYRDTSTGVANQYSRDSRRLFVHPTESFLRLYEFIPPNPQPFQSGDILGLFQPSGVDSRLQLLFGEVDGATLSFSRNGGADFDANGLSPFNTAGPGLSTQTNRLPLVAVEIESDDPDSADCTRDFISRDLLELLAPGASEIQNDDDGRQFVFPNYNFSCAGLITSWSLGLVEPRGNDARINYPQLQIWRRSISGDLYDRIASTALRAVAESPNQLYSVTIDPPLQFQSGDLLGMFLPRDAANNGRLRVLFGQNAGPTYRFADSPASLTSLSVDGNMDNDRPFLALEITISSPPLTLNSTTTAMSRPTTGVTSASPPTTAVTSASPPTELLPVIAIAVGASVGGVALAAVVTVLIIVAAVACARKKNQNPTDRSVDAINMTATAEETYDYPFQHEITAVSTEHNVNETYASTAIATKQNEAYALPTAPNAAYSSSTAVPLQSNEAYATTHGGDTATDEYEYIQ